MRAHWAVITLISVLVIAVVFMFAWATGLRITISHESPAIKPNPTADSNSTPAPTIDSSTDVAQSVIPAYVPEKPKPRYENVTVIHEGSVIQPTNGRIYHLSAAHDLNLRQPFHVRWESQYPVTMGLISEAAVVQAGNARNLLHYWLTKARCANQGVTQIDFSCSLPGSVLNDAIAWDLVVLDDRGAGTAALGVGAAMLGSRQYLGQAIAPNRAQILITQRRCVENCEDAN